jgi:hypothetical protein
MGSENVSKEYEKALRENAAKKPPTIRMSKLVTAKDDIDRIEEKYADGKENDDSPKTKPKCTVPAHIPPTRSSLRMSLRSVSRLSAFHKCSSDSNRSQ